MNEMTEITRLWDDVPEGTRQDLAPSRARLMTEMTTARRPRRLLLRAAVLVAGAVVAVQIGGGLMGNGPPANAADLLERAALAAAEQPELVAGPNQYIHTEMRTTRMITQFRPRHEVEADLHPLPGRAVESTGAGKPWLLRERALDGRHNQGVDDTVHSTSCDVDSTSVLTTVQLAHWPTDPAKLRPLVERESAKATAVPAGERMWGGIARLIRESAFRPSLTAALYRLAADLPGITLTENTADALGRPGIAVSFEHDGSRSELVFDRATYRFLGSRTVATEERTRREKLRKHSPEQIEKWFTEMVKAGMSPNEARKSTKDLHKEREYVVTTPRRRGHGCLRDREDRPRRRHAAAQREGLAPHRALLSQARLEQGHDRAFSRAVGGGAVAVAQVGEGAFDGSALLGGADHPGVHVGGAGDRRGVAQVVGDLAHHPGDGLAAGGAGADALETARPTAA